MGWWKACWVLLGCWVTCAKALGFSAINAPSSIATDSTQVGHHVIREVEASIRTSDGLEWHGTLSLPFRWDDQFSRVAGRAAFELRFPVDPAHKDMALWFPRVGNQVEVWSADGVLLAKWGNLHNTGFDAAKDHRLVRLPDSALAAGRVRVELTAQAARWGGMGPVLYGSFDNLSGVHRFRHNWRTYSSLAIVANLGLLAILSAGVWWFKRDLTAVDLGLGALAGMVAYVARLLEQAPLPWPLWGGVVAAAIWVHIFLLLSASFRMFQLYRRRLTPKLVQICTIVGAVVAITAFTTSHSLLWTALLMSTAPLTLWSLVEMAKNVWRSRRVAHMSVLFTLALVFVLLTWDLIAGRVLGDGLGTFQLAPLATLLCIAAFGFLLVSRQVVVPEVIAQARQIERERIMRDLHDGVGGHLAGLRAMLKNGQSTDALLVEEVDSALNEMRLTIDAMQTTGNDLVTLLATLRYRMQSRFDALGISVKWHLPELAVELRLPDDHVYHVQKMIMESLTNVLKHSGATAVSVFLEVPAAMTQRCFAVVLIEDNGRGMPLTTSNLSGHGLKNIAKRAELIGAQFQVGPGAIGGTRVQIRLRWND